MATKKILIQVILDDKASNSNKKIKDGLGKVTKEFKKMTVEQEKQYIAQQKSIIQEKQYTNELKKRALVEANVAAAQQKGRAQSGLNNAILLESGRLASDLNYGFTAIANNLGQLVTLFGSFAETNGGVINSFKELGKSLWGMGGILIGVQLLIAFGQPIYDFFTGMDEAAKKAAKSTKDLANSFDDLNANLIVAEEYLKLIKDVNTTDEERKNIIKELISLVPDLTEEDFKYGDNLEKVKEKINQYAIAQASRIEVDKLVEDNSELLSKRRKINLINEIKDDEERLKAIKKFAKEEGLTQKIQTGVYGQTQNVVERTNQEYIDSFTKRTNSITTDSDKILDKIRELNDTSFLGGKGDKATDDAHKKMLADRLKHVKDHIKLLEELDDAVVLSESEQRQVELAEIKLHYEDLIERAKEFNEDHLFLIEESEKAIQEKKDEFKKIDDDKAQKELDKEEKKQQKLQDIRNKYQLDTLKVEEDRVDDPETLDELAVFKEKQLAKVDLEEEFAIAKLDRLKLTTEEQELAITDIEAYYAAVRLKNAEDNVKTKKEIDDLETKSKLESLDQIGKGLMSASKIAGKATGAGKALAVAGTLVSTYAAAQTAYQSQLVPLDPSSKGRAIIAAASATLSGLANVKAIMSVKSPAMKETSAVTGGQAPVTTSSPDFNVVGQGGVNQLGQVIGSQFAGPLRAYVVSGDISTAQELDRNITDTATVG